MPTECSAELFKFAAVGSRSVVAGFDGGAITSDAGALLLGATDRAIRLRGLVPDDRLVVAESGVRDAATIAAWRAVGFDAALDGCKIEQFCATLCRHRGVPRIGNKSLWHNYFG